MIDHCKNCDSKLPAPADHLDWEAVCPSCQRLAWLCVGDIVICRVTKISTFGVFVELADHVEGLIHISELSKSMVQHPAEIVSVGSTFEAQVLRVDRGARKVALSRRRADPRESAVVR